MARPLSRHPTELELEILKILWNQGPCSVKQIQEALAGTRGLAYTTIMTMLTIMTNKKYVRRNKAGASNTYEAAIKQDAASSNMLQDIVDRVFDGSVPAVVQQLLESSDLDAQELEAIRQLISRKQKGKRS
jgi:BlaI family transcriptional regulator, penicillinase repressor